MTDQPDRAVLDDDEHTDPNQEDIGTTVFDGDDIPDDLDNGDLDDLVDAVDPDDIETPEDEL